MERAYGIPPLVYLATAVLCKYFTPPGVSPTPVALFSEIDSMDFTGDSGVAESANALQIHLGKVQRGRLKLDHGKVVRKLLGRLIPAENASIKEPGRDWSDYVGNLADAAVERGDVPATQADLRSLRSNLVEFGAAQTRRLAVRQSPSPRASQGALPRGSVAALVAPGSSVSFAEDFTSNLPPTASEFWPRGGKATVCRIQGANPAYRCGKCNEEATKKMSWCPSCGAHRPDSWACSFRRMISKGIGDYCRFRISGGCPRAKTGGRQVVDDKNGPDALRIKLMREARKAAWAKQKVW